MILKWQQFEHKGKFEKKHLFFRPKLGIIDIFFKRLCNESFEDLEFNSNWKFQTRAAFFNKIMTNFFAKLHKSPLLIVSIVKGAVSSLREFLVTESTWEIMKKCFLFHHNKLNLSLVNQILLILCILIKPNVWYSWSLKILAIKKMVSVQFCNNFTGPLFCGGWTKKLQIFSRHFFWERPSKYCFAEIYRSFRVLVIKLI